MELTATAPYAVRSVITGQENGAQPRSPGKLQNLFRIMRLIFLLILVSIMHVSAKTYSQAFSLSMNNVPVQEVFKAIQKQSDYRFFYNERLLKQARPVSIQVKNVSLEKLLDLCFKDQPLTYVIDEKQIIVKQKALTADLPEPIPSPPIDLKGRIINDKGEPVLATVTVKATRNSTTTNELGEFELKGVDEKAILLISGVNIEPYELKVNGRTDLGIISVKIRSTAIDEVTVEYNTGYQKISRERATGAYDAVGRNLLDKRPVVSNISTALNGLVAGLQGKENLDGSFQFLIRGTSSLYAQKDPLIVVDGFPVMNSTFSNINPNDVESISVLKDAAAASIWGARAANGVIVITTKQGKASSKKVNVEANVFTRVSEMIDLDQVTSQANSVDQVRYEKMAFDQRWIFPPVPYTRTFDDIAKPLTLVGELYYANQFGLIDNNQYNTSLDSLSRINNRAQVKDLLMQRAILSQYNINLSGGTDRTRTYASLLYEKRKEGFINRGYDRFGINFNNQFQATDFLSFSLGANLQYRKTVSSGPDVAEIMGLSPYETLLNPDGSYSVNINTVNREQVSMLPLSKFPYADWSYNLLREVRGREITAKELNARIQAGLNIRILRSLSFDSKFQYEKIKTDQDNYQGEETFLVRNMVNTMVDYNRTTGSVGNKYIPKGGLLRSFHGDMESYVFRNQLNYNQVISRDHSLTAIAGSEISRFLNTSRTDPWLYGYFPDKNQSSVPPYGYGSSVDPLKNFMGMNANLGGGNTFMEWQLDKYLSFYGNLAYAYKGKYVLSGSARSDASNYITDNASLRWSPLWSVGGMWNISKETFMKNVKMVDRLSLRLTYGQNGNTEKSTSTKPLLNVGTSPSTSTGTITATIADNGNPMLRWERTYTTNLGLDFRLFNNKLFGKIDLYNKTGKDITGLVQLAGATGATSQKFNNAQISNKGIELEIGGHVKVGKYFSYSPWITYAYNRNEIKHLYYPNLTAAYLLNNGSDNFVQGKPIGNIYSFTYLGMKDGMPHVAGLQKQPVPFSASNIFSQQGLEFLNYEGTTIPPHTLGWANSFSVYDFNLFVLITGKFGGVFREPYFDIPGVGINKVFVNRTVADVFAGDPRQPEFPKYEEPSFFNWFRYTTFLEGLVESSSYIECKEITLDYNLPNKILQPLTLSNLKLYVQVSNVGVLWRANSKGYHPEWLPGSSRPVTSFTMGATVKL